MKLLGDLELAGLGQIIGLRAENLAADPTAPSAGQIWYNTADGVYRGYDGTTVFTFASGTSLESIQAEMDRTQTGAGLEANGEYAANTGTNYLDAATSLKSADLLLDTELKSLRDALDNIGDGSLAGLQNEIDATQAGAGLSADGAYVPRGEGSVFIGDAVSITDAVNKLDAGFGDVNGLMVTLSGQIATAQGEIDALELSNEGKLDKAGGEMAGNIAMGGTHTITGLAAPVNATDAATKGYVDNALSGLDFQADVEAVQLNDTLVPELVEGKRYVITDPANVADEFGTIEGVGAGDIVEYDGAAFQVVYDVSEAGPGAIAWNRGEGTFWYYSTSWAAFGGLDGVNAGVGLTKTGNVLNVALGAGIGQLPTNEVGLDLFGAGALFLTEDGTTDSTSTAAKLALRLDGTTLTKSLTGLKVADAAITETQIADTVFGNGLTGGSGDKVAVVVKAAGGIIVDADGLSIDPTSLEFLELAGGTLTGPLVLNADPTQALEAATKQYVDALRTELEGYMDDLQVAVANATFVYDGAVSSVTHTVEHNIGSQFCNVTVVDSSNRVILPDSVTYDSANQLTVTFASAITCKVVVTGKYVGAIA